MEENEKVEVTETVIEESTTTVNGGWLKNKKNLIIAIIVAIIAFCLIFNVFFNTKGKAKNVIKTYCVSLGSGKYQKALKQIDPVGMYTFMDLDKEEYEDFWDSYKEFKKSDEWDEAKEEWDELLEEAKDKEEDFDKDDATKIKVKKITKFKKVAKNLYEVKAKIQSKEDGEDPETDTMTFYVMKDGFGCKLVGGEAVSAIGLALK